MTVHKPLRLVVAALILREGNGEGAAGVEVLICQRKADQPMSLKWEFPGGKIEPGRVRRMPWLGSWMRSWGSRR